MPDGPPPGSPFVLEAVAAAHEGSAPQLGYQAVRHLEPGHPPQRAAAGHQSALVVVVCGAPTGLLSGEPRWRR